ncbi:MAG TPA: hypothetical protein VHR97_03260 [Candidatus Baltobacteraceae bacterium]|nr:hypothetical protein [Candidatus Baltobacteraceae bacterium]
MRQVAAPRGCESRQARGCGISTDLHIALALGDCEDSQCAVDIRSTREDLHAVTDGDLLATFEELASEVRHPALTLDLFSDVAISNDEVQEDEDLTDEDVARLLDAADLLRARLRRGALLFAANLLFGRLTDDLILLGGGSIPDGDVAVVDEYFPRRFGRDYDLDFHRKLLATAAKVALDLANNEYTYPACTAEELVLYAIVREWRSLLELTGIAGSSRDDLTEYLFEDLDFEYLFDNEMDGIEDEPLAHKIAGMDVRTIADWFVPFNDSRIVHPYAVDLADREPDLFDLTGTGPDREMTRTVLLASAPAIVTGVAPISELVGLSRSAKRGVDSAALWIPDETNAAESFAELLALASGSGVLTLQPGPGHEITDAPVLSFTPQAAHPSNGDAWAEVMYMSGRSEVPLAAVVSFEFDPSVKVRWQEIFRPPS